MLSYLLLTALVLGALLAAHALQRGRQAGSILEVDEVDGQPACHGLGAKLNQDPDILRLRQLREETIASQMPRCLQIRARLEKRAVNRRLREAARIMAQTQPKRKPAQVVKIGEKERA